MINRIIYPDIFLKILISYFDFGIINELLKPILNGNTHERYITIYKLICNRFAKTFNTWMIRKEFNARGIKKLRNIIITCYII